MCVWVGGTGDVLISALCSSDEKEPEKIEKKNKKKSEILVCTISMLAPSILELAAAPRSLFPGENTSDAQPRSQEHLQRPPERL